MAQPNERSLRAEDLGDDTVRREFEARMIEGAQQLHQEERARLMAEGIVDSEGRLLKSPAAAGRKTDDGGGW
jgi:hypothetical protein